MSWDKIGRALRDQEDDSSEFDLVAEEGEIRQRTGGHGRERVLQLRNWIEGMISGELSDDGLDEELESWRQELRTVIDELEDFEDAGDYQEHFFQIEQALGALQEALPNALPATLLGPLALLEQAVHDFDLVLSANQAGPEVEGPHADAV